MNNRVSKEEYQEYIKRTDKFIQETSNLLNSIKQIESNNILESKGILDSVYFRVTDIAASILSYIVKCKSGVKGNHSKKISEKLTLITAYIQGFNQTELLILSGQYIKASAALKQDYEIITRIRQINTGKNLYGHVPNIKYAPEGIKFLYGHLNDIAHVSKEDVLSFYLAISKGEEKGVSPIPGIKKAQSKSFFLYHLAIICEIALEAVSLYKEMYEIDKDYKAVRIYLEYMFSIVKKIEQREMQISGIN